MLENLREAGFPGPIRLVNPKYRDIHGGRCFARMDDLAEVPDLMVVTLPPPPTVPDIVASAERMGVAAAWSSRLG